ncbi:hypothetical protein [Nocardia sp. NPDC019395]|uniref:hypothetical protein n=1 Tax=Nocardia sp. NPDC019395 TaxID=3154686 RepID=UPI003407D02D
MPADAAAEHTTSESKSTGSAETSASDDTSKAEPSGDTAGTGAAEPDATVKVDKAAAAESSDSKAESAADDGTVALDKASADETPTVATGKPASGESAGSETEETVKLDKSGAAAADEKPEAGNEAGKSSGIRSHFPVPVIAGAAVLLIAALVAVGVFFFLAGDRQDELDRRAAATKAACDFGNNFATYTGDKADDYVQRLDQTATGEWKKLVGQIGPDLKARFAETKVNSTAADVQCGYESGADDKARVVLVIDQQFTTAGGPQQQAPGRVKVAANVDMEKIDGTWMVANFDTPMMQQ